MFISIVDLDWWSWNSSQVSSGPFKELLGKSWYVSLRSTLGEERERESEGRRERKKEEEEKKKIALSTSHFSASFCWLLSDSQSIALNYSWPSKSQVLPPWIQPTADWKHSGKRKIQESSKKAKLEFTVCQQLFTQHLHISIRYYK